MQHLPNPEPKDDRATAPRRSLALRLVRAADALNPFLVIVVVGLVLLDVTLYVGLSVSREPYVWIPPRQGASAQTAPVPGEATLPPR